MRILWLSHLVPYPPKAGVLIRSYYLLRELSKHFEIDLLAFNQPALLNTFFEKKEEALPEATAALRSFCKTVQVEPIPTERSKAAKYACALTSLFSPTPYTIRWLHSEAYNSKVVALLSSQEYDLVHLDTESLAPYAPPSYSGAIALDHHNVESHMLLRRANNETNIAKSFYFYQEGRKLLSYERRTLSRFHSHVVCSDEDANRLREIDDSLTIHVAPNGVVFPEHAPHRNPDHNTVRLLFIGGLSWYPNRDAVHYFLDDIWPALTRAFPQVQLDVIGRSPSDKIVAAANTDSRIKVHGFVDNIKAFYRQATAYVCPIRDGGGTKLKIIDALANALPIIANPIACEGIDLIHGESVLFANSAEDYIAQLRRVVEHPEQASAIGRCGFETAKARYSVSAIGEALAQHYRELIETHSKVRRTS